LATSQINGLHCANACKPFFATPSSGGGRHRLHRAPGRGALHRLHRAPRGRALHRLHRTPRRGALHRLHGAPGRVVLQLGHRLAELMGVQLLHRAVGVLQGLGIVLARRPRYGKWCRNRPKTASQSAAYFRVSRMCMCQNRSMSRSGASGRCGLLRVQDEVALVGRLHAVGVFADQP
jgi:hypothetical protein